MSGYTSFISMTTPEAKAYLDQFLAEMGQSLTRFAASIDSELTYSADSLEEVWDAVRAKVKWRLGYQPPRVGQPGPRILTGQLEPRSADAHSEARVWAFLEAAGPRCRVRVWMIRRCARLFHCGFLVVVPVAGGGQVEATATGGPSAAV